MGNSFYTSLVWLERGKLPRSPCLALQLAQQPGAGGFNDRVLEPANEADVSLSIAIV